MIYHIATFAWMLAISLIYSSELGWSTILQYWFVFIVGSLALQFLFNAPILAILLKGCVAFALMTKARMR